MTASTDVSGTHTVLEGPGRWVRLVAPGRAELENTLAGLGISDLPSWGAVGADVSAAVTVLGSSLVISFPVHVPGESRNSRLLLVRAPEVLVSVEDERLEAIDRLAAERRGGDAREADLSGLLVDLLEEASRVAGPTYLALRRNLEELADSVEAAPQDVTSDALLAMKRRVSRLSLLWEEQEYGLLQLQRRVSVALHREEALERLRSLISDADRGLKLLAGLEGRVRDLWQHHLHSLQESTNRRLNMLAILSALYLPPTLIAGIYGMNLQHIPMAEVRYGYFGVLAMMATVVVGQLLYFARRGWFR